MSGGETTTMSCTPHELPVESVRAGRQMFFCDMLHTVTKNYRRAGRVWLVMKPGGPSASDVVTVSLAFQQGQTVKTVAGVTINGVWQS